MTDIVSRNTEIDSTFPITYPPVGNSTSLDGSVNQMSPVRNKGLRIFRMIHNYLVHGMCHVMASLCSCYVAEDAFYMETVLSLVDRYDTSGLGKAPAFWEWKLA